MSEKEENGMGILDLLRLKIKKWKIHPRSTSEVITEVPKACICKKCGNDIPITEDIVNNKEIYCSECTTKNEVIKKCISSHSYEVFVYTIPCPAIRAYCRGRQWLPTYQADTQCKLDRTVSTDKIPPGATFASITLAISQHGSITYMEKVPALLALRKDVGLLCAYVPKDFWEREFRII